MTRPAPSAGRVPPSAGARALQRVSWSMSDAPAGHDANSQTLNQRELDELLLLNGFLEDDQPGGGKSSLIDEIKDAILDSGKLRLGEWRALRARLSEIERLIPTIDLIIELRTRRGEPGAERSAPATTRPRR